ncbi:ATP-binding protein [Catenuloplanes indicus]|uniref:Anti-sigma regulatory factor (Ser/Thr protein kinase) n=1 Tax=Catenuloplanes indicus TaxID=137267 RepID=A0AAE3VVE7_9ACTN|nr:ATP-binding protein [Catenuloplanes indicus]MDQ0364536.1 anti-sigma regulatory factor (Ser/Thr protein kinase) [Catenuloplanes indicus]
MWTLHTPDELRRLRAGLGEIIADAPWTDEDELADVPERMVLVASELATNAIRHGQPPTEVRLLRTEEQFVLDVIDHDPETPPEPTEADDFDSGGRGLHIAQRLSLDVGWYTTDNMSKHVWASFPITEPSAAG